MAKIAFLFPGQGAQTVGMGRQLYESLPAARRLFDEAAEILGYRLIEVCAKGPAERLNATDVSQPALFVCSLAALESLKASEPATVEACQGTAGLSLGEYTALVFAGALSFADGLRVVQKRGAALQVCPDHLVLALGHRPRLHAGPAIVKGLCVQRGGRREPAVSHDERPRRTTTVGPRTRRRERSGGSPAPQHYVGERERGRRCG